MKLLKTNQTELSLTHNIMKNDTHQILLEGHKSTKIIFKKTDSTLMSNDSSYLHA